MKYSTLILLAIGIAFTSSAYAQDAPAEPENFVEDEVIATARKQNDPAMNAFLSGDYETAEIEFDRNAFCALRAERNFAAGIDSARESSLRSDAFGDATGGQTSGADAQAAPAQAPTTSFNSSALRNDKDELRRTCEDRGYQVYMKGMSQLQLGKRDEAKKTFTSAIRLKRTLFDAHFRLSLMAYQDGDYEKARKQLNSLQRLAKRCKRCEAKAEIEEQITYLVSLLEQ